MNAGVRFLYLYCNDLVAVRHFYTDLLGRKETFFAEGKALAYSCDHLQFTVFQTDQKLPVIEGWTTQPGWRGGTQPSVSWSVECGEEAFKTAYTRLKQESVTSFYDAPKWVGYWSYTVRDPIGHTVELTCPEGGPNKPLL